MPYWVRDTEFKPFNDSSNYYGRTNISVVTGGMNTSVVDNYREGINLRNFIDVYKSTQVKVSFLDGQQDMKMNPNSTLNHESTFQTYGQAVDFIQFTGNKLFNDSHKSYEKTRANKNNIQISSVVDYLIDNGNIVDGVLDADNVYPIYLNGGPQFIEEAIVEPLPIPYRLPTNESPQELARGIFAFYEDGNYGDERRFGANEIQQAQYRDQPLVVRPYLEYGSDYLIITASGKTQIVNIRPSAIPDQTFVPKIKPWVDEPPGNYFPSLIGTSLGLVSVTVNGLPYCFNNYETSFSSLQTRDQKSSAAGYSYYGPNAGYYGTDSIAFGGLLRGT